MTTRPKLATDEFQDETLKILEDARKTFRERLKATLGKKLEFPAIPKRSN